MSEDKAILILNEMPKNCFFCPLQADIEWFGGVCSYDHYMGRGNRLSRHGNHNPSDESRPEWCPLRRLPKKNAETADAIPKQWIKNHITELRAEVERKIEEENYTDYGLCDDAYGMERLLEDWEKENGTRNIDS